MFDTQTWKALRFPFCQRKARLSLCLTVPLADSPHMGRMQDAWIWSYTSGVRVSCSDTHTSDKYLPLLLRPYPALGIRYVGPCLIYRNAQQEKVCHRLR